MSKAVSVMSTPIAIANESDYGSVTDPYDTDSLSSSVVDPKLMTLAHQRPKRSRFFQWVPTDNKQLESTERCMLAHVKEHFIQRYVAGLNTISSIPNTAEWAGTGHRRVQRHIVLLHGFGGGLAMWVPNFNFLVEAAKNQMVVTQVHAIDMPGFARSERHPLVSFATEKDAMDYMTGHLREWFAAMGIDKPRGSEKPPHVDLVGHSFGGYVSAQFTSRYPTLVKRLVLCDPWGVPAMEEKDKKRKLPFRIRMLLKLFYAGNPLSALRFIGPWGPDILPGRRPDFADRWAPIIGDPTIFFDYIFHCNAPSVPTGEQAFQACCHGTAFAKQPLMGVVPSIPSAVDISVIYGANTWMDKPAGVEMMRLAAQTRGVNCQSTYCYIQDAGHQVNTDNVAGFNDALGKILKFKF